MGSKTLKHGKRTGLTRNQRRKLDYATLATQARRTSQTALAPGVMAFSQRKTRKVSPWKKATREYLHQEALIRQGKRDSRSIKEQLALLATRPGNSLRETARLLRKENPDATSR